MFRLDDLLAGLDEFRGTVTNALPSETRATAAGYEVCIDMPGIDKATLTVELDTQEWIVVKAQRTYTNGYIKMQHRNVMIPRDVDLAKITATYENGVVTLTLPKRGNTPKTPISVTIK